MSFQIQDLTIEAATNNTFVSQEVTNSGGGGVATYEIITATGPGPYNYDLSLDTQYSIIYTYTGPSTCTLGLGTDGQLKTVLVPESFSLGTSLITSGDIGYSYDIGNNDYTSLIYVNGEWLYTGGTKSA
jgi:hypothetical protein